MLRYIVYLPIARLMEYPSGAGQFTRPSLYTDSAVPFMNPPPTQVANYINHEKQILILHKTNTAALCKTVISL